ncbi:TlpA disulfide reductase family protein [soil metagenome]
MVIPLRSVIALLLLTGAISACDRQSAPKAQDNATADGTANISSGEVAPDEVKSTANAADVKGSTAASSFTIDRSKAGTPAPAFTFAAPDGSDATLKDFAGKPILVNLWATWCAPCVAEMPTLDAIAGDYGKQGLQVLTISQDTQGPQRVNAFFAKRGFKHIKPWLDTENQFGFHYATGMLPTSVLYDAQGKEVARVIGALDWQGKEGEALIAQAMKE